MADVESMIQRAMTLRPEFSREDAETKVMDYYVDRAMKLRPDMDRVSAENKVLNWYDNIGAKPPQSRVEQSRPGREVSQSVMEPEEPQAPSAPPMVAATTAPAFRLRSMEGPPEVPTAAVLDMPFSAFSLGRGAVKGLAAAPRKVTPDAPITQQAGEVARSVGKAAVGESPFFSEIATQMGRPDLGERVSEGEHVSQVNKMVTGAELPQWSKTTIDMLAPVIDLGAVQPNVPRAAVKSVAAVEPVKDMAKVREEAQALLRSSIADMESRPPPGSLDAALAKRKALREQVAREGENAEVRAATERIQDQPPDYIPPKPGLSSAEDLPFKPSGLADPSKPATVPRETPPPPAGPRESVATPEPAAVPRETATTSAVDVQYQQALDKIRQMPDGPKRDAYLKHLENWYAGVKPAKAETPPIVIGEPKPIPQRATRTMEGVTPERPTQTLPQASVTSGKLPTPDTELGQATIPTNLVQRGVQAFKRFWSPLSTLPKTAEYQALRNKTFGQLDRVEHFTEKVWKQTKDMSPDDKRDIFRVLDGQLDPSALNPDAKVVALRLRYLNNSIGKMLVQRGMLSEETFLAHKDQYVRYTYLKHVLGDKANKAIGGSGRMDLSYIKARTDLTNEQRRAIGLIEDVSVAQPVGMSKSLSDVAKHDMFAKVAQNPSWVWQPSIVEIPSGGPKPVKMSIGKLVEEVEAQRRIYKQAPNVPEVKQRLDELEQVLASATARTRNLPPDFVQLPTDSHLGDLAGAFVRVEIARDILPVFSSMKSSPAASKAVNAILDVTEKGMTAYKISKTALNVPTVFRNTVSNFIQLNMSGIPIYDVPRHMMSAAQSMANKDQVYTLALRNGLFKTNFSTAEIQEVLDTVRTMQNRDFFGMFAGVKKLTKYYGKIDDFFKLTKFSEQLSKNVSVEKAAAEAQKWGMDYTNVHPAIKVARRFVTPFASYPYKITPLIAESIAKRPWVIAKYMAIPAGMAALARQTLDLTDADWERLQKNLPVFVKKNQSMAILPWKSPEGQTQWVNLEYFFPWQQGMAVARDVKRGAFGEVASDIGMGNPWYDIYAVLKTMKGDSPPKDMRTGREIFNKLDTPTEKAVKTAEWLYNRWAPPMLTREGAVGTTGKMLTGDKDRYGRTVTPGQAGAKYFGVNVIAPTPLATTMERKQKIMELKLALGQILKDPKTTPEKKQSAMLMFKQQMAELLDANER